MLLSQIKIPQHSSSSEKREKLKEKYLTIHQHELQDMSPFKGFKKSWSGNLVYSFITFLIKLYAMFQDFFAKHFKDMNFIL